MNLNIPTAALRDALGSMASLPGAHGAAVFTQAVKLEAGLEGLILTRFTSETKISITISDDIEIEGEGQALVDHAALSGLVSRMPQKGISIGFNFDKNELTLRSGEVIAHLKGYGDEAAALPPDVELETESIELAIEELDAALKFCLPSVCKDETSKALLGVGFRRAGRNLLLVGADKTRVHVAMLPYPIDVDCVVPTAGIEALRKAIEGKQGKCTLAIGETGIYVSNPQVEFSSALSVEKLPSIGAILARIESSKNTKIQVEAAKLSSALKTCSAFSSEGEKRFIPMQIAKDRIKLVADNQKDTHLQTSLPCEASDAALLSVPSSQLAQTIDLLPTDEGKITMWHDSTAIFFYQPKQGRMAFIATGKPITNEKPA